jgi:hypothetical protein
LTQKGESAVKGIRYLSMILTILAYMLLFPFPGSPLAQERFIDNGDGTVTDTKTNLMWAQYDNLGNINWHDAKAYCEWIILSTYEDWRMPTIDELATLYDRNEKGYKADCGDRVRVTPKIHLSCGWVWARDSRAISAFAYNFARGYRYTDRMVHKRNYRALPVRTVK